MVQWRNEQGERELAEAIEAASVVQTGDPDRPGDRLRPGDPLPSVWMVNGCGKRFYGRSDQRADRSHVSVHCVCLAHVPVWPLGAWRVRDEGGIHLVLARARLPRWMRWMRWLAPAVLVLMIAAGVTIDYLDSPGRLAGQRWDAAIAAVNDRDPEASLRRLDDEIQRDASLVDDGPAERAGAAVVRLAARAVAAPFTPAMLDAASRVVARYQALPTNVREGAAREAMLAALDGWIAAADPGGATDARLTLLGAALGIADGDRRGQLAAQITQARLALARQTDAPVDALAILVDLSGDESPADRGRLIAAADAVVARLAESPSLLVDAALDLDAWTAATGDAAAKPRIAALAKRAQDGRAEADADGVTPAQLAAMASQRPWDQFVALQLARQDASAGKLDAAAARIDGIGPPNLTIRDARLLRAQLTAARGDLAAADAMLAPLLGGRLARLVAASRALDEAARRAQAGVDDRLRNGTVPADLRAKVDAASDDAARRELVQGWVREEILRDPAVAAGRAKYQALSSVVPVALEAGSIKLRRAQALSGAARDAMLQDAERTFLAIRSEAEGQPSFRLALGEIYARLGKTAESDAELGAVLAKRDPRLSLDVASVYRGLGNVARATQIAKDVYAAASSPAKEHAATMIAIMSGDDEAEAEAWYRKADQRDPTIRASLLEIEGARLDRQGKIADCEARFAAAAKIHLGTASASDPTGYNNAAVAYQRGFDCSGDPRALRDAEAALERAYRSSPEMSIVVRNLIDTLDTNIAARALARRVDLRALRLRASDISAVVAELLDGPERDALRAEIVADPGSRRRAELLTQLEVLAPSSSSVYDLRFALAHRDRDAAGAAAVVERARRAKAIDHSQQTTQRARWISGTDDAVWLGGLDSVRARLDPVVVGPGAARLDPRTRAVGRFVLAIALGELGLYRKDPALLARAREVAAESPWPALDTSWIIASALIDEAGLAGDAKAWIALRRTRSAIAALDQLVADHASLAATIRGSSQWAEIGRHPPSIGGEPTISALRLARLLGDAALEARARAVLDDKLTHLERELEVALDPGDEIAKANLAYLDAR